jgi:L,D-peptidoglycan transpeptidase YkuD (ErfK/YbiS/YcfS/YnhG family)
MARGVVIAFCALLVAVAPAAGERRHTARCAPTLANQLADTGDAAQLITVVARTARSTSGSLRLWRKSGDCWVAAGGPWFAWLGQRGVSETRHEGDRTTPAGAFGIQRTMYGLAPNPGVRYAYRRIRCGDWWVEDPKSPYYNRFHHVRCGSKPPFRVTSEDMSRSPTAYRHLAVIDFNTDPIVRGRGSGIFLHHSTGRPTLGCVSLPLAALVKTLRWLRPESSPLVVIGTADRVRDY